MFKKTLLTVFSLVILTTVGCSQKESPKIETDMDKISYSIGWDIGQNLSSTLVKDFNLELILQGMRDAQSESDSKMTEDEMMAALMNFQELMMTAQQNEMERKQSENLTKGQAFLAENAQKEGVITTESGLQYKVIEEGTGARPTASSEVTVHYRGTLIDGTEFDSSFRRGQPVTFPVNGVIAGWTEALQLMREGAKYELYIPSNLGYGERGTQGPIGPNAVLIFEVELLEVN